MAKSPKPTNVKELETQIVELTEALKRERADSTNLRRQHEEQIAALRAVIKTTVMIELLPVIDNLERSMNHVPKDLEGSDYVKGVNSILKQFNMALEKLGVERIKTVGETFDPYYHEAVSMEEGDGDREVVVEELQPGYKINDQVIRHAMVKVKMQS
jgi:molecular chaperone GrpE